MKHLFLLLLFVPGLLFGQPSPSEKSKCHVFIDHSFIWTLEMVATGSGETVPVVNIVTFARGAWDLRPDQIHLFASPRKQAEIERFSIDTGVPGDPYYVHYLKVRGESFIGLDLEGDFQGFDELIKVAVDLGDSRFVLQPIDCFEFESLVAKINEINFDSPDIRQDYAVLGIDLRGNREAIRRHY